MQIEEGINVDANWTGIILIGDGSEWHTRLRTNNVLSIGQVFIADPASTYRFDTITKVRFNLVTGDSFDVELQEVSNQPTWNLGTKVALDQAMQDLNTILST